ncbi:MAG: fused MFS/spermidine synthase [Pseudomonadales bacterium]
MLGRTTRANGALLSGLLTTLFFLSGFSALLYQVIWQRMLGLFSGADVYSATIIVSAFMLGMGVGSLIGGYLADRLNQYRCLLMFALAELVIAVFAVSSKWFYYDVLYQTWPQLSASKPLLSVVLFLSLLIPTFCMGITLPLLSKALTRYLSEASFKIAWLYALNTLGAGLGALVTGLFLVRHYGFEISLQMGAALNAGAMVGALLLALLLQRSSYWTQQADAPIATQAEKTDTYFSLRTWLVIYALSGFVALGLEIVWFRILGVMLKSTSFTFSILLFFFLVGLAIGTILGLIFSPRSRRPVHSFLLLQAGIAAYAVLSISALVHVVDQWPSLAVLWQYFASPINFPFAFELSKATPEFLMMYFIVVPLLIVPPTILMGASFPYLQRINQTSLDDIGKRVGALQTANILGSTLGSILVGLVLLHFFGSVGALKILLLLGAVYWFLLAKIVAKPWLKGVVAAVGVAVVVAGFYGIPNKETLWAKLHGTTPAGGLPAEDSTGVSYIKGNMHDAGSGELSAYFMINGATQSAIPYENIHTALSYVPAVLHPAPEDILIIGLGSGNTLWAAGGRPETKRITNVEILGSQWKNLRDAHALKPYAAVQSMLDDKRMEFVIDDGRTWLMRSGRQFDIIETDALRPFIPYAGNLYSSEYFTLLKNHLKPGGYVVNWIPTGRTIQTFRSVFPYTLNFGFWMFIGSDQPIKVDKALAFARARDPFTNNYYTRAGIDPVNLLQMEFDKIVDQPQERWTQAGLDINYDLFPKDEFEKPEPVQ